MIILGVVCLCLVTVLMWVLHRGALEREELYRRIQSPEVAKAEDARTVSRLVGPAFVPFDDDAAFHRNRQEMNNGGS